MTADDTLDGARCVTTQVLICRCSFKCYLLYSQHRIRRQIETDDMQFGFMKGNATANAIFMARQVQKNFRVKGKKLYFGFVDLKKLLTGCQEK